MTKDDTKDGDGEGFIEAEVVSPVKDTKTPNTRANDDLPSLKSSKDKKHGILDFVSFYSFVLSALIFYLGVFISNLMNVNLMGFSNTLMYFSTFTICT